MGSGDRVVEHRTVSRGDDGSVPPRMTNQLNQHFQFQSGGPLKLCLDYSLLTFDHCIKSKLTKIMEAVKIITVIHFLQGVFESSLVIALDTYV